MNHHAWVALAVILTCLSTLARAEDPNHVVITVMDGQGAPLAGVKVTESETARQYMTDANGQFICQPSDQVRHFLMWWTSSSENWRTARRSSCAVGS